ncbi:MAG: cytochrome c biogenesis CcdA family protein [Candidatus Woesearchaeota archaeon]
MSEISLPIIVGAALIDGINPCAFGVLIFMLAYLAKTAKRSKMLVNGLIYILFVFITYLVCGLILLPIIRKLAAFSVASYYVIASAVILAGLLEIKDYFWYGKGPSLAIFPSEAARIKKYVKHVGGSGWTAAFLGTFVALVELPCTGAVYLAVLALMSLSGVTLGNVTFLVIYNLIFVVPLIIILFLVYRGIHWKHFEEWRQRHKGLMRLFTGILLIVLGIWMIEFTFTEQRIAMPTYTLLSLVGLVVILAIIVFLKHVVEKHHED